MNKNNIQENHNKIFIKALPKSWTICQLGDVICLKNGYAFKSKDYSLDGIPLVRISDINEGKVTLEKSVRIPEDKANLDFVIQPGDLLIAMSGATTGKTGVYNGTQTCLQNQRVGNFYIISEDTVDKKYRNYYIASLREEIEKAAYGGAQPNISGKGIESFDFPLAPINEQKHIVAEIEKQFSRLDKAVDNLKRIKANLKRYKASVLKSAVEGKLTEEWRKTNPDVEPADKLLKRILVERRKKWEETELNKMKAKGKIPKDDNWKKKYKEPFKPNLSDLPKTPITWQWSTFDHVSTRVTVGHVGSMKNEYKDSGIPFLRSQNVRENKFSPIGLKYINRSFHEKLKKSSLKPGDIVVVRSGNVGITCTIPSTLPESNCSDLVIIKQPLVVLPKYGSYYMNSITKTRVASQKVGIALTHFNTKSVAMMPIPVPPLDEQIKIVSEVEKCLSIIAEISKEVEQNLLKANRLRQSILKKAFTGKLVPQEKNSASNIKYKKVI